MQLLNGSRLRSSVGSRFIKLEQFKFVIVFFSVLAAILSHFLWLRYVPGLQFDEGWYGKFAHRITTEPGFWPLSGNMTSYTTAFPHYLTALFFKIFGTHLFVYRAAGMVEVLLGIGMISLAFAVAGERRAAVLFPGVVAFFPALVINQRWVVELTTFCALTSGMIALGISLRWKQGPSLLAYALIIFGVFFGVTAHLVFLAPVLALWLCLVAAGKIQTRADRTAAMVSSLSLLPFFIHIFILEEDKSKGLSLMLTPLLVSVFHLCGKKTTEWVGRILRRILVFPAALGSLLFIPLALFMEGNWLAKFSNGMIEKPALIGLSFLPPVVALGFLLFRKQERGSEKLSRRASKWIAKNSVALYFLPLALLLVYLMVIKAGPRYLEPHFLFVAGAMTLLFSRLSFRPLVLVCLLQMIQGALVLGYNYHLPSIEERQEDRVFFFWRWRDGSGGFLPKLRLMNRLASEGCTVKNVAEIEDGSTGAALEFLSIGDWPTPVRPPCRLGNRVSMKMRADLTAPDQPEKRTFGEGQFWLVGSD